MSWRWAPGTDSYLTHHNHLPTGAQIAHFGIVEGWVIVFLALGWWAVRWVWRGKT